MGSVLNEGLSEIWGNNTVIMNRVQEGSNHLGLQINRDEVAASPEFFMYGKLPVYWGKFISVETKKWTRVSAVTNDQIPPIANTILSVSAAALTVCQTSDT